MAKKASKIGPNLSTLLASKRAVSVVTKTTRKQTNRLSHEKVFQLFKHIEDNKSEIERSSMTMPQMVLDISKKLGFKVNSTTIEQAFRTIKIQRTKSKNAQMKAMIVELKGKIANLEELLGD